MSEEDSTLWQSILEAPANVAVCALNLFIFAIMWNYRIGLENCSISYELAVSQRQFYRVITSTFTHLNILHVAFNVSALYGLGATWELERGTAWYLQTTVAFVFLAGFIDLLIIRIGATRFPAWLQGTAVGYSGVVYAWAALNAASDPWSSVPVLGIFPLWSILYLFVMLVLNQIVIPNASFVGHLAGVVAGFLAATGLIDGVPAYWFWTTVALLSAAALLSVKANAELAAWARLDCIALSPAFVGSTGLGSTAAPGSEDPRAQQAGARRYISAAGVIRSGPAALLDAQVSNVAPGDRRAPLQLPAAGPWNPLVALRDSAVFRWRALRGALASPTPAAPSAPATAAAPRLPAAVAAGSLVGRSDAGVSTSLGAEEDGRGAITSHPLAVPAASAQAPLQELEPAGEGTSGGAQGGGLLGRILAAVSPRHSGAASASGQQRGARGGAYQRVGSDADDEPDNASAQHV